MSMARIKEWFQQGISLGDSCTLFQKKHNFSLLVIKFTSYEAEDEAA